ncbi:MAG: aminopeptidase, partial [Bacteroidaceae bacterium]|nr:aminopeptidase [Bacteroidaceae bacterium]
MKSIKIIAVLLLASVCAMADKAIEQQLAALSNVVSATEVKDEAGFDSRYILKVRQPLSHKDPSKGSFTQRVIVMHRGFDRPTLVITEGYGAGYAAGPRYN